MSTFRKTVLTTAIVGAGLVATTGSAFASEGHHESGHSGSAGCANLIDADNATGVGEVTMGAVTGGSQAVTPTNVCDNLNGNSFLNGNNFAGGDIHNGNSETVQTATTEGDGSPAEILTGLF